MTDIFQQATRQKIRFDNPEQGGRLTVEDLWQIKLPVLNTIAKALNRLVKEADEEDYLQESNPVNAEIQLKHAVAVAIIKIRKGEEEAKKNAAKVKAEIAELTEELAQKEREERKSLSKADLQKQLDEKRAALAV